jgi:hypothetical protein
LVIVKNAGTIRKLAAGLISDKDLYEAQDMAEKLPGTLAGLLEWNFSG